MSPLFQIISPFYFLAPSKLVPSTYVYSNKLKYQVTQKTKTISRMGIILCYMKKYFLDSG